MKVAGIDCGTNSIRLLIAEAGREGRLRDVVRRMEVVRLGQGVDATGEFAQEALERTFARTEEYAALCREHGVTSIRFAATSAARDARNRDEFIEGIRARIGVEPQILTGEQEARASFEGAASAMSQGGEGPVLTVDLGGGSTELALGMPGGQILGAYSMDVGCVRLRERHLASDPPTAGQIAAARSDVRSVLDDAEEHVDLGSATELIGLAGTVTTLTATALGLERYDPARIHGTALTPERTLEVCQWYMRATRDERAALGFMHPGRVDVIASGALIWGEIVTRVVRRTAESGRPLNAITTSEHDILDGLAMWAARQPQAPKRKVQAEMP